MKLITALLLTLSLLLPTLTHAGKLTQKEFDELMSMYNMLLDNRKESVDIAMETNKEREYVIDKMCLYVGTFESIQLMGLENQHLEGASEAVDFGYTMKTNYDEFFRILGTTYEKRCNKG